MTRRVVLYVTANCHLCDDARALVRRLGVSYLEIDATGDPARFLRTPVVEVDGVEVACGDIDPKTLRRALR